MLLAILELGTAETAEWFAAQEGRTDPGGVLHDYVTRAADEASDPRVPGFVRAVGAVMTEPLVAEALALDEHTLRQGLLPWVRAARRSGEVRSDLSVTRLTNWLMLLLDGFLGRLAGDDGFTARREKATLHDAVRRLLAPQ